MYSYQPEPTSHTAEINRWLHLASQSFTAEEQRYCYIRILEIDERNVEAQQGMLRLGNGPAYRPDHVQGTAPILIIEPPKAKQYLLEQDEQPASMINDQNVKAAAIIFLLICITIAAVSYLHR